MRSCVNAWLRPKALIREGATLNGLAHAAIDVSDGVAGDSLHISEASNVAIVLEAGALERAENLAGRILKMCVAMGGSITGEHGIGMEKREYLPEMFSAEEIDCMKRLRAAFDPLGIANPGKMFPGGSAPALQQQGLHPLEKAGIISRE